MRPVSGSGGNADESRHRKFNRRVRVQRPCTKWQPGWPGVAPLIRLSQYSKATGRSPGGLQRVNGRTGGARGLKSRGRVLEDQALRSFQRAQQGPELVQGEQVGSGVWLELLDVVAADHEVHAVGNSLSLQYRNHIGNRTRRDDSHRNALALVSDPSRYVGVNREFLDGTTAVDAVFPGATLFDPIGSRAQTGHPEKELAGTTVANPDHLALVFLPAQGDAPRFHRLEPRLVVQVFAVDQGAVEVEENDSDRSGWRFHVPA